MMARRFTPPWTVVENPGCYTVVDASGFVLTYVYFNLNQSVGTLTHLTKDEARRLAVGFARLPSLLTAKAT